VEEVGGHFCLRLSVGLVLVGCGVGRLSRGEDVGLVLLTVLIYEAEDDKIVVV
jgi:hypothetical protein